MDGTDDLPLRQITRLRAEMGIVDARLNSERFPGAPTWALEFGIAARVSLPDWVTGGTIVRPTAPTRAIAVRRIALSTGNPPETTRRHVAALIARGMLTVTDNGVALAATPENEPFVRRYYRETHDLMVRLIDDLAHTTELIFPVGDTPSFGVADVIRCGQEILLQGADMRPLPTGVGYLLWVALTAAAVRRITYDPELSRRYANSIPPDELREGVSLRRLAAVLSVSYATAWRQFTGFERDGLVTRLRGDRWTVLTANLLQPTVLPLSANPSHRAIRVIRGLTLLGLDPARADRLYLGARPRLIDFGADGAEERAVRQPRG